MGRFRLVTPSSFQLRFNRADNRHTNCRRGADKWGKVPACRRAGMMGTAAKSDEANFGGQIGFGLRNLQAKDFGLLRAQERCAGAYVTVKRVAFPAARTRAGLGGIVGPEGDGKARCRRSAGNRGARTKLVARAAPSGRTSR